MRLWVADLKFGHYGVPTWRILHGLAVGNTSQALFQILQLGREISRRLGRHEWTGAGLSFRTVIDWERGLAVRFTWLRSFSTVGRVRKHSRKKIVFVARPLEASERPAGGGVSRAAIEASNYMAQKTVTDPGLVFGQKQLASLLDSTKEIIAVIANDGTLHFANSTFQISLGYRSEELIGRSIHALVHPADVQLVRAHLKQAVTQNGAPVTGRCRIRSRDGSWRWFENTYRSRLNDPGLEGILVHGLDVTELHRLESERQVISEIVHALNQTGNLDQLLTRIHEALKRVLSAENCFVALHDPVRDMFEFAFFADEFDSAPPPQKVGRSCTAYVFRTGKANLIPQSVFDRLATSDEVELVGSPSPAWLGVPLKTPTATIGVLVVQHYQNENAYDQRDLEFLDSVGGHIALAIERRRAEEELRKSESMLSLLFEHNPLPTWLYDLESLRFIRVNQAAVGQYGYSQEEFEGMSILEIRPETERDKLASYLKEMSTETEEHGFWLHRGKDGKTFEAEMISHELIHAGRRVRLVVAQDISERRHLELQLRQAQKMEAVGRLAGGVAHDFNNLLMVIKGHTELLLGALSPADAMARKIEQIDRSADRATTLTRQLLAFSRLQVLQPQVINLNSVVEEMGKLLPRLIGEDIELILRLDQKLGSIRADASQMEQVIMNLAVNARDAMPSGGKLLIETRNCELEQSYISSHPFMKPGSYILLDVTDTGTGMDEETQAHIFEPFFTTKEKGKGTGLGLATVYGIVKQSGGFIWVYSELKKGTSFKIYLPLVDAKQAQIQAPKPVAELPAGTETVLLSEDEQDVREIAREFLESGGYTVIEAKNGKEAIELAEKHGEKIDLLVTDMVMPGMTGQELAVRLQREYPGLAVVFMSGYSEHAATEMANADPSVRLMTKPFSRSAILRTVREILQAHKKA
jgi:two-component system, cell cycle sensor histidine kinase and response regulator CckA